MVLPAMAPSRLDSVAMVKIMKSGPGQGGDKPDNAQKALVAGLYIEMKFMSKEQVLIKCRDEKLFALIMVRYIQLSIFMHHMTYRVFKPIQRKLKHGEYLPYHTDASGIRPLPFHFRIKPHAAGECFGNKLESPVARLAGTLLKMN